MDYQWRSYGKCHPVRPAQVSPHTTPFYFTSLPYPFSPFPFLLPSPSPSSPHLSSLRSRPHIAAKGPGGALMLPQWVRVEFGHQTLSGAFSAFKGPRDFMTGKSNKKLDSTVS